MAVRLEAHQSRYVGLSTDTKPTEGVAPGSTFFETDTKRLFMFDGRKWLEKEFESNVESLLCDGIEEARRTNELLTILLEKF